MTREEAIQILSTRDAHGVLCGYTSGVTEALDMAIEALSADRPSGEWEQIEIIDDDAESGVNDEATECSICGYVYNSYYWAKAYFNFCPNCGAKMKGGAE